MNEYDSSRISDLVANIGYKKTENKKDSDCFILNTCNIREKAAEKVYHEIGRIKKEFKNSKKPLVIIAGCVAQAESGEMIKRESYIDIVVGPQSYHKIPDFILNHLRKKQKINATEFDVINKFDQLCKIKNSENKISSYLTIQEGCDKFCNFCVVPYTRGPEYSRPFNQILDEAVTLVKNGAREIILLGQNVNAYNFKHNNKKYNLSDLIKEFEKISNLKRIRFITSHPKDMSEDLIECFKNSIKLVPFLHLPVQSGSNKILKFMNRKHDTNYYLAIIEKLKKINRNMEFSSDFIIGYPGENDKDFKDTIHLIKKVKFINSFSFIYSPRLGTPAAGMKLNSYNINQKRLKKIQDILQNIQIDKNKKNLGKQCEVLVENKIIGQNKYFGRNKSMTPVIFNSDNCTPGDLISVKISSFNQNNLFGMHLDKKIKAA